MDVAGAVVEDWQKFIRLTRIPVWGPDRQFCQFVSQTVAQLDKAFAMNVN